MIMMLLLMITMVVVVVKTCIVGISSDLQSQT